MSGASPTTADFKGLRAMAANVGQRFHRGVVLHTGHATVPMGHGLWAMPIDALWRLSVGARTVDQPRDL